MTLSPMDRRRANSAFEALAYETADVAQRLTVLDAAAAGLASADLTPDDRIALDTAGALLRSSLHTIDRAADNLVTAIATPTEPHDWSQRAEPELPDYLEPFVQPDDERPEVAP